MNKNILQRRYYIVVSYYTAELGMGTNFTKEEAHDLAYSELYTRCRSIAGALVPCGVETKILTSEELAELLFIAYNKDDADIYNVKKALNSGFYRLYSSAQDVVEKKRIAIDNAVKEKAIAEAELALKKSMDRLRQNTELTYEQELSDSAKRQAMQLILDNGSVYLFAYSEYADHGLLYDLNYMTDIYVTKDKFQLPEKFAINNYTGGGRLGAYNGNKVEKFKIKFTGYAKEWIKNHKWADDQTFKETKDSTTIIFSSSQFERVLQLILSWGQQAKPIAPTRLVKRWKEEITAMYEMVK
jgi:predicted DNA-binding transcriptional regulator YafY